MSELVTCYRGCVNTWECDEMGHMNVRYYVSKAEEGLAVFSAKLGLTPQWLEAEGAELVICDQHIRYLREMRAGEDLLIDACLISNPDTTLHVYQEMRPTNGTHITASLLSKVELRDVRSGDARTLPPITLETAAAYVGEIPQAARPRSVPMDAAIPGGTKARAEELGLAQVSLGKVMPLDVDQHGRLRTENYLGRVSDGIGSFMGGLRAGVAAADGGDPNRQVGGAALEYRLMYHKRPKLGDLVVVYVGLLAVTDKVFHVSHWTVDAQNGEPICSSQAVAISLDLDARKAIAIPPSYREVYESRIIPGLRDERA